MGGRRLGCGKRGGGVSIPLWKHEAKGLPLTARHAAAILARMEGDDAALAVVRAALAKRGLKPLPAPIRGRGRGRPRILDRTECRQLRTISMPAKSWAALDALRGETKVGAFIRQKLELP